jgi:dimethylhistidine N-methyltransferase
MRTALHPKELGPLEDFHDLEHDHEDFESAVLEGLGRRPKSLPSKFFYDERGSKLFDRITELPEYYPTRTEIGMLQRFAWEIAETVGAAPTVVEFGAGSVVKIRLLLDAVHAPVFVPLDISREHLMQSSRDLAADYPDTRVIAICADFTRNIELPQDLPTGNRLGFFPGSTLGNFTRRDAEAFLVNARKTLGPGSAFLVGIDLRKDEVTLRKAYNDSQGVTAAFNLNILRRINRELGGNFDLQRFAHDAPWLADEGRIEMHLVSKAAQTVTVAGRRFDFAEGEYIHTEYSHKYGVDEFRAMAQRAGYNPVRVWVDDDNLFSLHYLKA